MLKTFLVVSIVPWKTEIPCPLTSLGVLEDTEKQLPNFNLTVVVVVLLLLLNGNIWQWSNNILIKDLRAPSATTGIFAYCVANCGHYFLNLKFC